MLQLSCPRSLLQNVYKRMLHKKPFKVSHIRFTQHDEYFRYDDNETTVTFGISDYAQNELGDIVFVDLPTVGHHFSENDQIATVESVKAASDMTIPIKGI